MKKIYEFILILSVLCTMWSSTAMAAFDDSHNQEEFSTDVQYYKTYVDENEDLHLISVTKDEYQAFINKRSAIYVEGWEVVSLSGLTTAYISLHYQTVTSAGKKVFDLSNSYFEVNPQNGYAGSLNYLSSSVHSLNMRYDFQNKIGDMGYRTHRFYPQQ